MDRFKLLLKEKRKKWGHNRGMWPKFMGIFWWFSEIKQYQNENKRFLKQMKLNKDVIAAIQREKYQKVRRWWINVDMYTVKNYCKEKIRTQQTIMNCRITDRLQFFIEDGKEGKQQDTWQYVEIVTVINDLYPCYNQQNMKIAPI